MPPPSHSVPELPRLTAGVQLLEAPAGAIGPLHTLVLDTLLRTGGEAVWIDADDHGPSTVLAELAPSPRVLERIRIARAFTPYQHQAIVRDAAAALTDTTRLIVAPAFDAHYRTDDIRGNDPAAMLLCSLARVARYARRSELPVLLTRVADDAFSAPIGRLASDTIAVERTAFGPRFVGTDFETLVYSTDGETTQTTLAYWSRLLCARRPVHQVAPRPTATARS